jgi:DNA-binding response OmpR family regulator
MRTGFGAVSIDEGGFAFPDPNERRLPFFFFHRLVSEDLLLNAIARIRSDERQRFSPAVLIVGECSENDVVRYIGLGFDDIVTLPEAVRVLERRFAHQLGTQFSYFETANYFGPDRRRAKRPGSGNEQKRPGEFRYVRYLIQRASTGVDILRREVLLSSNPPVPTAPVSATVGFNA